MHTGQSNPGYRHSRAERRGVAMLLVLIALASATIMATAYLASRDNSAPIGANAVAASEARWASMSGIELAVAVLQTESDWRTEHVDGKIVDDLVIGDATVDIDIIDLETELPPTAESDYVEITSSATCNGVTQTSSAQAVIMPSMGGQIDVDLAEFAIFAGESLELNDMSTVARWEDAPTAALKRRIAVGSNGTRAATINVTDSAEIMDSSIYLHAGASGSAYSAWRDQGAQLQSVGDTIPMPEPPAPPDSSGPGTYSTTVTSPYTISQTSQVNTLNVVYGSGVLTFSGDTTYTVWGNLTAWFGGSIVIDGNVVLDVRGNATISDAEIILTEGSTLVMHVGGDFEVENGYIGNERDDDEGNDITGGASYFDVDRLKIYAGPSSTYQWDIQDDSVVKANLYTPSHTVRIFDSSALYGRVAATSIELHDDSGLFYDHALGGTHGYTNPASPLWSGGSVVAAVAGLASLGNADLTSLADALGISVNVGGVATTPAVAAADDDKGDPPASITPRTIIVEHEVTAFGERASTMETHAVRTARISNGDVETKSAGEIVTEIGEVQSFIGSLSSTLFSALGGLLAGDVQDTMETNLSQAAALVSSGDYSMALFKIKATIQRFDGESDSPDAMGSSSQKKQIHDDLIEIYDQITKLQAAV